MRLGGTVVGHWETPEQWEALLAASRFRAITAPFDCHTPRQVIDAFLEICRRRDVTIAEIGVWKNPFDPDPRLAQAALDYAVGQLRLADEVGIPCCVNIVGTASAAGWSNPYAPSSTPRSPRGPSTASSPCPGWYPMAGRNTCS